MRGSIQQSSSGRYHYVLYHGRDTETGKKKYVWSKGFRTKKEAEDALALDLGSIVRNEYVLPDKMLFKEYISHWLETYGKMNLKETTLEGYTHNLTVHVIPYIGDVPIQALKPFHLQSLYQRLLMNGRMDGKGGLSGKTILQIHRIIGKILSDTTKMEVTSRNVSKSVTPPKVKEFIAKIVKENDVAKLLELYANNKIYIAVVLALNLGLRRGECLSLTWSCVDFESKTIRITKNLVRTKTGLKLTAPKTSSSIRTLLISDALIKKLKEQKLRQEKNREVYGEKYVDTGFIVTKDNGECINPSRFSHNFKDVILKSDWAKERYSDLCYHSLRHYVECFIM